MTIPQLKPEIMKILDYEFYHQGCCDTILTEKFPEIELLDNHVHSFEKNGMVYELDRGTIVAPNHEIMQKALIFKRRQQQITKVMLLNRTQTTAEFMSWCVKPVGISFKYIIPKNMATVVGQVFETNGTAHGKIMCPADNFNEFMDDFESRGVLKVKSITKQKPEKSELTPSERNALKTAIMSGYYNWPRKVTLEEMGRGVGLSRRGFQDNLRRAEEKIMNKIQV